MRDKLIELLFGTALHWSYEYSDEDFSKDAERTADYLLAHGVTVQEWIPVSERLPEDSGLTLVRVDFYMWDEKVNVPSLERYVNEEKAWFCDGAKLTNVTHWMPLPAAPKEVEW